MTQRLRFTVLVAVLGLLLAAVPLAAAGPTGGSGQNATRASGMQFVTSFPGAGGTDLEFFSRTLASYKLADGTMVTPEVPVERHFAMVGNQSSGAKIVDITDPTQAYVVAAMGSTCIVGQGDIQIARDGTIAAIASQSGNCRMPNGATKTDGSVLVDMADPYKPTAVGFAPNGTQGSHNNTIHPSGNYLYISPSGGSPAQVPIYDISDIRNPRLVRNWTPSAGDAPHDIRFSPDGTRAYLAGIRQFRILNTSNPEAPTEISTILAPGSTIGHDTLITPDKRFLFLGDELNGGSTAPCPGGAIYAYDLTNESAPLLLGVAEAGGGPVFGRTLDDPTDTSTRIGGCTSHVMDLNPDKKSLTLGWYVLGSRIFDFSSFYNADGTPKTAAGIAASWGKNGVGLVEKAWIIPEVGGTQGNTWSAKQYAKVPCYVFSDDLSLGLYISKITVPNAGCTLPPAE